ncbi:hypothetical protein PROAA_2080003 [Candidatus Propionivibrio aalborgensis]|uniref:Uncharacterized protein n=1 Tax=Candidatus Propionivibrio aalborgensis TaxID=1860101 RepID=A0A1A8XSZ3_9RHOO|nr:hypothetical protein PROAA_2080003 [Candidatus Propionivibrio aalborgensis]
MPISIWNVSGALPESEPGHQPPPVADPFKRSWCMLMPYAEACCLSQILTRQNCSR